MGGPYIVGPQRLNGRPCPNFSLVQIKATLWLGASNESTAQRLFRPKDKLAVMASAVRELASASLRVALRPTWTRYAPL
jgi:hypothetical protein